MRRKIRSVPTEITSRFALAEGDKLVQIDLGSLHTGAISAPTAGFFLWGNNEGGTIGDNTYQNNRLVPTEITSRFTLSENEKIVKIELGSSNSAALTNNGALYVWGSNVYGEIGDGSLDYRFVPRCVQSLVADISYGVFLRLFRQNKRGCVYMGTQRLRAIGEKFDDRSNLAST
ncbi:MAG: hypothetical protein MZW92_12155 [Comamonadaceae bacterium]|nr:hypothetical protein [Comamonadaceae bacterium]